MYCAGKTGERAWFVGQVLSRQIKDSWSSVCAEDDHSARALASLILKSGEYSLN